MRFIGLNRYICDVLENMRKAHETHNYSYLPALIEEAQIMANKMESALGDVADYKRMIEDKAELKKELKELDVKIKKIKAKDE